MTSIVKIGIIGCGNVCRQYFEMLKRFDLVELKSLADLDMKKAVVLAAELGVLAVSTGDLLSDPEIDLVVNLTVPAAHAEISLQAISAGKHVYSEKPLAITRQEGRRLLKAAQEKGVLIACAPDHFLGPALQTCRKLIDTGQIGTPIAATAFSSTRGPEFWHPDPNFYYQAGAGPLFDLGPYLLTALVFLLGPVRRVTSSAHISFPIRQIFSQPNYGKQIRVEVPTYIAGVIDFAAGSVASIVASFDIWHANQPSIEIFGSEGTLSLPGPNKFSSPVRLRRENEPHWSEVPLIYSNLVGRGIGVIDLADAIIHNRTPLASGELAFHVLDLMHSLIEASDGAQHISIESACERPFPLDMKLLSTETRT